MDAIQLDQLDGSSTLSVCSPPCGDAAQTNVQQTQSSTVDCEASGTGPSEEKPEKTIEGSEMGFTLDSSSDGNVLAQSQADSVWRLKPCHVRLEKLHLPPSVQRQPASQPHHEAPSPRKPASKKAKQTSRREAEKKKEPEAEVDTWYMAPISDCSGASSWSFYSDEDSCYRTPSRSSASPADTWSIYSSDASSSLWSFPDDDADPETLAALSRGSAPVAKPPKTQVYCFICKEHQDASLRTHMETHFPTGKYACPSCDRRFKRPICLKTHMLRTCFEYGKQQADPDTPDPVQNCHRCDVCHSVFRYKLSLSRHRESHHELYCAVCRKVLRDQEALARHRASHTAFQCFLCERSFARFALLLRHCENVHELRKPFECSRCPKTLSRLRFLIHHEWTHTGHLPFRCAQCGGRFKFDSDLVFHQRVHTKLKPFLCAECGKTFTKNSNLLRHLKLLHSGLRQESLARPERGKRRQKNFHVLCPQCGKMIKRASLDRHLLIHTGEKPFRCPELDCDKSFRSATEVKRHVLVRHTKHRPFTCKDCGKGFARKGSLTKHARVHSGKKLFVDVYEESVLPQSS